MKELDAAALAAHRDKWIAIGLSTERADFDVAESAVRDLYRLCGLDQPKIVIRMGSPYAAIIGGIAGHAILDTQQVGQHEDERADHG